MFIKKMIEGWIAWSLKEFSVEAVLAKRAFLSGVVDT